MKMAELLVSDLAKWNVRGPVRTLRIESALWDLSREEWQPSGHFVVVAFRPDGKTSELTPHNPDGCVSRSKWLYDDAGRLLEIQQPSGKTVYSYDEAGRHVRTVSVSQDGTERSAEACTYDASGRKTKVHFLAPQEPGVAHSYVVEGTEHGYGAPGAATMTVNYDQREQPAEVLFHDADRSLVRRVVFTRDGAGRLLSEELHFCEPIPFPTLATLDLFGPSRSLSSTTYSYEPAGRLSEQFVRMGALAEERTVFRYDEDGNPIEKVMERHSRQFGIDELGTILPTSARSQKEYIRFEYRYDSPGNWTERVVWSRLDPNPDFQRSNVERREIAYYPL